MMHMYGSCTVSVVSSCLVVMARAGEFKATASWEPPAALNSGVTVRAGLSYHKVNRGGAYDIFLFSPPSLRNKMLRGFRFLLSSKLYIYTCPSRA